MKNFLICIVENDSEYRKYLLRNLKQINGAEVKAFQTLESALYNNSVKPDFIILDQKLSSTRGIDFLPFCREILPDTKILVLSAREDISTFVSAFDFGADEYIKQDGYEISRLMSIIFKFVSPGGQAAEPQLGNPLEGNIRPKREKSIYLLDDDESSAFFIKRLLSSEEGNKVTSFLRSTDFIDQLFQAKPDVIVLDYNLEEKVNGLDILKKIKKEFSDITVIILSGQKDASLASAFINEGAANYFVKSKESYRKLKSFIGSL